MQVDTKEFCEVYDRQKAVGHEIFKARQRRNEISEETRKAAAAAAAAGKSGDDVTAHGGGGGGGVMNGGATGQKDPRKTAVSFNFTWIRFAPP